MGVLPEKSSALVPRGALYCFASGATVFSMYQSRIDSISEWQLYSSGLLVYSENKGVFPFLIFVLSGNIFFQASVCFFWRSSHQSCTRSGLRPLFESMREQCPIAMLAVQVCVRGQWEVRTMCTERYMQCARCIAQMCTNH